MKNTKFVNTSQYIAELLHGKDYPTEVVVSIDMQKHFQEKYSWPQKPVDKAISVIKTARDKQIPVVTVISHSCDMKDLSYIDGANPRKNENTILKKSNSAFDGTELEKILQEMGTKTITLVGGHTRYCVWYTFLDGKKHGYNVKIPKDAIIDPFPSMVDPIDYFAEKGAIITDSENCFIS